MLALSPKGETTSLALCTHNSSTLGDPCCVWIALNQALNDIDDWAEGHSRCTFAGCGRGRSLTVEKIGGERLRIVHQQQTTARPMQSQAEWRLSLDNGTVHDVTFDGAPADLEAMEELADLLWAFHRLAVEDRVSMLRE